MTHIISAATQRRRRSIRSGIAGILAATALVSAIGCSGSDSSTGPSNRNPAGTYALFQVNGKNIPCVIFRGPYVVTATGGELILEDDGALHSAIDIRLAGGGDEVSLTRRDEGSYEIDGDQIVISSEGGGQTGSYRNGVITLKFDLGGTGDTRTYTFRYVP